MKFVFDTNILISAFLTTTGTSQYVFNRVVKRHSVILSEYILHEFEQKLKDKFDVPKSHIKEAIDFLRNRSLVLEIPSSKTIVFKDKKDIPILSLIEIVKPDYFVTGDKKLLELKKMETTLFLTPRETMELLNRE